MPTTPSEVERSWQQLLEAGQYERHFDVLEGTYRTLASTWLLAAFAGVGFTIANAKHMPFDWQLAAAFIALLGAIGLLLLWMLDVMVYHRLLDVVFFTARAIEQRHADLPPFRIHMVRMTRVSGAVQFVLLFYIAGIDALLLIMTIFAASAWSTHVWAVVLTGVAGVAGIIYATLTMRAIHQRYRERMLKFFGISKDEPEAALRLSGAAWVERPASPER